MDPQPQNDLATILEVVGDADPIVLFDMEGALLNDPYIVALAKKTGARQALERLFDNFRLDAAERTRAIARLFAGVPEEVFESTARDIPLLRGVQTAVRGLRKAGFCVGLITDSFSVAADIVRLRVFADFSVGHRLSFRQGRATGEIALATAMTHPTGCRQHTVCKSNFLVHLRQRMDIESTQIVAIGDGHNDNCMLGGADFPIAYHPLGRSIHSAVNVVSGSLNAVLDLVLDSPKEVPACLGGRRIERSHVDFLSAGSTVYHDRSSVAVAPRNK